ncbi:uncharacterized protein LOC119778185 isoform X1 [Cyprinodon tularosa]|uniref:uncharacterized protein LOC119778185 isoform X1 n=1 Tax=Cyprinodon tularosa TaxID=77115 RepID=UPI0018E219F5|nr:uncharacterized protein LOC119778185 isoform X1 [Cyprinodon tularosa]
MFNSESKILQLLAVLEVCHGLAPGQITSRYLFIEKSMTWVKGREFCQSHFVDLAVLNTEMEYFALLNTTHTNKASFWLGLHRHANGWKWTDGDELSYRRWYNYNYEGQCASLEAMLEKNNKLLARLCDEEHMIVCQGPVSPQSLAVDSVSIDHVNLSWNVSAFMQTTSHYYSVMICSFICKMLFYPYNNDSHFMSIKISNLTAATEYSVNVSAVVVRLDSVTGKNLILQDHPATLKVKTATPNNDQKIVYKIFNFLKLMILVPVLWFIYNFLKIEKCTEKLKDRSSEEPLVQEAVVELLPQKSGLEK